MAQISPANGIMLLCTWIICTAQVSCSVAAQDQGGSLREGLPKVALSLQKDRGACTENTLPLLEKEKKMDFLTCSNDHLLM